MIVECTIAYVNAPKGNARSATIKDTGGAYYGIDPKWQGEFTPGVTYKLEYETDPTGKYRNVKRFKAVGGTPAPAGQAGADPGLAERIYTCGILNAMMSNANINPMEVNAAQLAELTQICRAAYHQTFGSNAVASTQPTSAKPTQREDMNGDEVPW